MLNLNILIMKGKKLSLTFSHQAYKSFKLFVAENYKVALSLPFVNH